MPNEITKEQQSIRKSLYRPSYIPSDIKKRMSDGGNPSNIHNYRFYKSRKTRDYEWKLYKHYFKKHLYHAFGSAYVADCYFDYILDIYSPETNGKPKFDFIVLVAKKACVLFRAVMRLAKARDGYLPNNMPIIIDTRTMSSYTFLESGKERKDVKVLVFDDILNRGRNIGRVISSLNRQGIRNIYYSALGINVKTVRWENSDIPTVLSEEWKELFSDVDLCDDASLCLQSMIYIKNNPLPLEQREDRLREDYILEISNYKDSISSSVLRQLSNRIQFFEFDSSIIGAKLPVYTCRRLVTGKIP
ncbi:MAG: hypothetical protein LBD23_15985, partial [Oscillospiraceae bacterium]|nr:hypothetical protein [Oscillospiraceae bacterium]